MYTIITEREKTKDLTKRGAGVKVMVRYETFKSVYEFEKTLNQRPVNKDFGETKEECSSSRKGNTSWYQTKSYEEADDLLVNGWNAKIGELKSEIEKFSSAIVIKRRRQQKSVVGFMPCVPNAIKGVPKAMISYTKKERLEKLNTKHIIYSNCECAGTSGDTLLKAGLTILKMAMILDKSNVRTKIDIVPFESYADGDFIGCSVNIKEYRQPFNYSKMAYPIANPSFFRRHGFRYLETLSGNLKNWTCGYGGRVTGRGRESEEYYEKAGYRRDNAIYIGVGDCEKANFDPEKLMTNMGIK